MNMVEKVARAMYADTNDCHAEQFDTAESVTQQTYLSNARIAIEAMREPTQGMRLDGHSITEFELLTWQVMIDKALEEQ